MPSLVLEVAVLLSAIKGRTAGLGPIILKTYKRKHKEIYL